MVRPHICVSCRMQILSSLKSPLGTAAKRSFSQKASGRLDPEPSRDASRVPIDLHGELFASSANSKHENSSRSEASWQEADYSTTRGRYSRRELRPEEILRQLDRPWEPDFEWKHAAQSYPDKFRGIRAGPNSMVIPRTALPVREPSAMKTALRRFIDQVREEKFVPAWQSLQKMYEESVGLRVDEIHALVRTKDFTLAMTAFNWTCTKLWFESLQQSATDAHLPPPSTIFRTLRSMHAANSSLWRPVLWQMASIAFSWKFGVTEVNLSAFNEALNEFSEFWFLCLESRLVPQTQGSRQDPITDNQKDDAPLQHTSVDPRERYWDFLPDIHTLGVRHGHGDSAATFEDVLVQLVPVPPLSQHRKLDPRRTDYASPALIFLDLARTTLYFDTSGETAKFADHPEVSPLVQFLDKLLAAAPQTSVPVLLEKKIRTLDNSHILRQYKAFGDRVGLNLDIDKIRSSKPSEDDKPSGLTSLPSGLLVTWSPSESHQMQTDKQHNDVRRSELGQFSIEEKSPNPQISAFTTLNIKRLSRALERTEIHVAQKIQREIMEYAASHTLKMDILPLELWEHLMLTMLVLRQPETAISVWNHILQAGYTPTVKTYTAMMRGAHTCRDVLGLEAFWNRMRKAGIQPDETAWATRIFGLFKLRRVKEGNQALREMGQEWSNSVKGQHAVKGVAFLSMQEALAKYPGSVGGVPRPGVGVMNSAISALALSADREIPKVLAWGRSLAIEPDLTTYNVLLNITMRHGQADEAEKILQQMRNKNIEADDTTWTVLLTAMFEGGVLQDLDETQQTEKVLQLVDSLSGMSKGSGINEKGYALVIDRLLKIYANHTAAGAVLEHMISSGRRPTSHIYTILMASYFQHKPHPDFAAVESLWKHISAQDSGYGAPLDNVFFDRMIEGYASHHHLVGLQPALTFLKRMEQQGKRPSWSTLEVVARALAARGEKAKLSGLVSDVREKLKSGKGVVHVHPTGQRSFWNFILSTGLLHDEGVRDVQTLMWTGRRRSSLETADLVPTDVVEA